MLHIKVKSIANAATCKQILCPLTPPLPNGPRGWGQKIKIQLFQDMVMLHFKLKGITKCSKMVANILCADPLPPPPPPTLVIVSIGRNSTCSENGNVAYQIKGITKCSNMVANILCADPPPPLGWGQ